MNIFKFLARCSLLPLLIYPAILLPQEILEMEGTAIIGNKELPKVLYIVPWKSPERFDIRAPAINSILDQPIPTLERGAFRRRIYYYQAIFSSSTGAR